MIRRQESFLEAEVPLVSWLAVRIQFYASEEEQKRVCTRHCGEAIYGMKTLQMEYPETLETVLNLDAASFAAEARMALSVKLFELGRLSSGQAAGLAGMGRVQFLLECPRYGTPVTSWDEEELRAEFAGLEGRP